MGEHTNQIHGTLGRNAGEYHILLFLQHLQSTHSSYIKGFDAICKGEYDHLPEAAFYMVGTIEEAVQKAEKMAKEAAA